MFASDYTRVPKLKVGNVFPQFLTLKLLMQKWVCLFLFYFKYNRASEAAGKNQSANNVNRYKSNIVNLKFHTYL